MRKLICRILGIYHFITMTTILFSKCTGQIFRVSFRVDKKVVCEYLIQKQTKKISLQIFMAPWIIRNTI